MDTFIQLTVDALTLGSVYALIALGYTLIYGVLKLLNFAHGDVFMVGSFIGFGVLQLLGGSSNPSVPVWLLLPILILAAMAGCAVLGVVIERFAYRPLRDAPRIAPLISALGVSFFLANSMQLLFGAQPRNYDTFSLSNGALYLRGIDIGNVRVPLLANHHDRLRLRADDRPLVPRQSNPDRQGHAGHVVRPRGGGDDGDRHRSRDRVHLRPRLRARRCRRGDVRAPRTDHGLDRVHLRAQGLHRGGDRRDRVDSGRDGGGLLLGFAESYTQGYISTKWSDLVVFSILIAFMIFRPQGLLGRADIRKV